MKGQWQINGCNKCGYWIADRYYYKFKNKEEREQKLELALAHAAYWYTRYSFRNPLPPKTVYMVTEIW
ncbi:hypothetical protein LCGC14_2145810 [marine sediment metagenome]|uniref:Uncharacterized protein n=1 Tax=marine sediment metagenome TaxID=412755 RepID=A0A0F9DWX8_9ZZZZ